MNKQDGERGKQQQQKRKKKEDQEIKRVVQKRGENFFSRADEGQSNNKNNPVEKVIK